MRKLWVVAKHEYVKITRKRSFLLGTLAMPLFFVVIMALAIVVVVAGEDQRPDRLRRSGRSADDGDLAAAGCR